MSLRSCTTAEWILRGWREEGDLFCPVLLPVGRSEDVMAGLKQPSWTMRKEPHAEYGTVAKYKVSGSLATLTSIPGLLLCGRELGCLV